MIRASSAEVPSDDPPGPAATGTPLYVRAADRVIIRVLTQESTGGCLVNWTMKSVLILVAVIVFIVAAIGVKVEINLIALGLAFFAAAFIVPERNIR